MNTSATYNDTSLCNIRVLIPPRFTDDLPSVSFVEIMEGSSLVWSKHLLNELFPYLQSSLDPIIIYCRDK